MAQMLPTWNPVYICTIHQSITYYTHIDMGHVKWGKFTNFRKQFQTIEIMQFS